MGRRWTRPVLATAIVGLVVAGALPAGATHNADTHSANMALLANVPRVGTATQSDLAFQDDFAFAGAFNGFRIIDISNPASPTQVTFFPCNGSQGDISVWGDLVFSSVDTPQSSPNCNSTNVANAAVPGAWEGVRIFDISDPTAPVHLASVATDCGSHTHTLVPRGRGSLFIYVSSYALTAPSVGPNCEQFHGKISVIHVPMGDPADAEVVAEPEVDIPDFDASRVELDDLVPPGFLLDTNGCHDISVLTPLKIAAAACLSVGQLWDIEDPTNPVPLRTFDIPEVAAWHSAAFTWDGERVAFGDEAGGGNLPRCRPEDASTRGAVTVFDVDSGAKLGHYKIPRFETGICTMHNFNFVPGIERDILVSSAYTGGTTVADLTDPANPVEIGFYKVAGPPASNAWSSYWHNGFVYANDIVRGLDVFSVAHSSLTGAANLDRDNPQTQTRLFG